MKPFLHIPNWVRRAWKNKTAILAAVLTGGETLVQVTDFKLPGSDSVPVLFRAVGIVGLIGGAFYFRWKAQKELGRASAQ